MKKIKKLISFDKETILTVEEIIKNRMQFSEFIRFLVDDFLHEGNFQAIASKELNSNLKRITISLNEKDIEILKQYSLQNKSSISKEIRNRIQSILYKKEFLTKDEKDLINNLVNQLIKVGTNINSIAKYYNIKKEINLSNQQEIYFSKQLDIIKKEIEDTKKLLFEIKEKCQ